MSNKNPTTSIRQLVNASKYLHSNQTVMLIGRHGIGKSAVVKQIAKTLGLPIVERRLGQLEVGDIIGLPDFGRSRNVNGQDIKVTSHNPPDWFVNCMIEPHVIFLDELNRAAPDVLQCVFQFVENGELNGKKVHPDCRIFVAMNGSQDYDVNEMDSALMDRFVVFYLDPSRQDFLRWAKSKSNNPYCETNLHPDLIDFLSECNDNIFEYNPNDGTLAEEVITPSRRSWQKLNEQVVIPPTPTAPALIDDPKNPSLRVIARAIIGPDSTDELVKFLSNRNEIITPLDVCNKYRNDPALKKRVKKLSNEKPEAISSILDKLKSFIINEFAQKGNECLTKPQKNNLLEFCKDLNKEQFMAFSNEFQNNASTHSREFQFFYDIVRDYQIDECFGLSAVGKVYKEAGS